jgi:hypothetical protein
MPDQKDIVLAVLGASVALAGLLLVFCGFLFTQADSLPSTTRDEVIDKYRRAGKLGLVPFLLALIVAGDAFAWLLCPTNWYFWSGVWGFVAVLCGTAIYGGVTICRFA